jgi:hypothetical protein
MLLAANLPIDWAAQERMLGFRRLIVGPSSK